LAAEEQARRFQQEHKVEEAYHVRHVGNLVLAVLLTLAFTPFRAGDVSASCAPGRSNNGQKYWVGRSQTVAATQIRSNIYTYNPYVYSGFSWTWVMLGGSGNYMWAQIGPEKEPGGRYTFLQYAWPNEYHWAYFSAPTIGSSPPYQVTYNPSSKVFFFEGTVAPGYHLLSVYIPQWVPSGARISGEITTAANQMMGATSNHEVFSSNKIWYGGSVHDYSGTVQSYNSTYFGQSGSATAFDIWDKACST
jgi:hypothetical protein